MCFLEPYMMIQYERAKTPIMMISSVIHLSDR